MSTLTTTVQHSFGSLTTAIREEKKIKGLQIGKEEVKLSLFAGDMILYIENPEDSTRKLLELVNEYIKVASYKINTQKSLAFLYINNEKTEREIKETIQLTSLSKDFLRPDRRRALGPRREGARCARGESAKPLAARAARR